MQTLAGRLKIGRSRSDWRHFGHKGQRGDLRQPHTGNHRRALSWIFQGRFRLALIAQPIPAFITMAHTPHRTGFARQQSKAGGSRI